jgi:regulatory protein YycH of two-component signal transduction system YycFG
MKKLVTVIENIQNKEISKNMKMRVKKRNVYLPSLRMKVPDHVYVFGSLLLQ